MIAAPKAREPLGMHPWPDGKASACRSGDCEVSPPRGKTPTRLFLTQFTSEWFLVSSWGRQYAIQVTPVTYLLYLLHTLHELLFFYFLCTCAASTHIDVTQMLSFISFIYASSMPGANTDSCGTQLVTLSRASAALLGNDLSSLGLRKSCIRPSTYRSVTSLGHEHNFVYILLSQLDNGRHCFRMFR